MLDHVVKTWKRLNEVMFDEMLRLPQFEMTTRGKFPVRLNGLGVYRVNPEYTMTENDLIVEMCYQLLDKIHGYDEPTKDIMLEAYNRGYTNTDTKVIHEGKPTDKRRTGPAKWSCDCTLVRCSVELDATCDKCNTKFVKED